MKSLDTNLLFVGCNAMAVGHEICRELLLEWSNKEDVVICELVLTELYNLLRNPAVMSNHPLSAGDAVKVVRRFRHHPRWRLVENAPVMEQVWEVAGEASFPRRRIFDARIALTLLHHGVTEFATVNLKDFHPFPFQRVWNPLESEG
jgi:toxin-antitoxin system PIN domain toxin